MRIFKQTLDVADTKTYLLPGKTVMPISVKNQNGYMVLYFLTDVTPDELFDGGVKTPVTIHIVGTGHERDDIVSENYLGTVMLTQGALVFHCFYKMELSEDM